jgi:hypothetical protein
MLEKQMHVALSIGPIPILLQSGNLCRNRFSLMSGRRATSKAETGQCAFRQEISAFGENR